ncbi:DUF7156 family protein [Williamsia sp. R60]
MTNLPDEFFLPPQSGEGLRSETIRITAGCIAFLVILGITVALTQGIVITL